MTTSHTIEFSAVMAVFNLLLRVFSSFFLHQEWGYRKGVIGVAVVNAQEGDTFDKGRSNIESYCKTSLFLSSLR